MIEYNWVMSVNKFTYLLVILSIFLLTFYYKEDILIYYDKYFSQINHLPTELETNEYYRNYDFKYVSITDKFNPKNKKDILNIYYTVINSGMDNFTFYCDKTYLNCINDVTDIANNQATLSHINNFVHPYNGFKNLETEIDSLGKITLKVNHNYTDEMKIMLNYKIEEIINQQITDNMNDKEKIKVIHDYIINNTKYDKQRSDQNIIYYKSDTAYGVLIEGYGLCGGYTDSMMLFLEKFNIKNYKIASNNHVWNYVFLDNNWYNLDLTWDDPINKNQVDTLDNSFFLISDEELKKLDSKEHNYDKNVYG